MHIVLLGPPGAGKGSLASLCHSRLGVPHLSTGEIFRREIARKSPLGRRVARYVTNGRLVPDALVVEVMASHLRQQPRRRGFVLDGFPRTRRQAEGLARVLERWGRPLDGAVYLTSPEDLLVRRLSGRRVCPRCGANYHLRTMRPKRLGLCDQCGTPLVTRKDDQPRTIRKRLAIDRKACKPLIDYYRKGKLLYRVNGAGYVGTVFVRMRKLFRRQGWLRRGRA
ncbi:MAG: adenylate kinase [Candidatus Omnitrophica bacterium CG11_big_fil_rev_8_21_14_0_20_63_9]|nr:MAG: adenylate kinase [Candidatus Omnitrophica bacterium CG11_big_fil_rev_8_21_14_0_20_63_9]